MFRLRMTCLWWHVCDGMSVMTCLWWRVCDDVSVMTCLWWVLGVAGGPFHMTQDAMWSGYADQGFPGNQIKPHWDPLGSWKKKLEMKGLEPPRLEAIVCFPLSFSPNPPSFYLSALWGMHPITHTPEGSQGHAELFLNCAALCFKLVRQSHYMKSL